MKARPLSKTIAPAMMLALLAACATGPRFQSTEEAPVGGGQVYVYRPTALIGGVVVHKVTIDGRAETLNLPNGSWMRVPLPPGAHTIAISTYVNLSAVSCGAVQIDLRPGQTAFVANIRPSTQALNRVYVGCAVVSKSRDEALNEMANLSGAGS